MEFRSIGHRGLRRLIEKNDGREVRRDLEARLRRVITALILAPDDYAAKEQRQFFTRHIGSWMSEFFSDLAEAKQAVFYRSVAEFSQTFMRIEKHYFSMEV